MENYQLILAIICKASIFSSYSFDPLDFMPLSFLYIYIVKSFIVTYICLRTFTSFPVPHFASHFYCFNLQGFPQEWSYAPGRRLTGIFGSRQIVPSRLTLLGLNLTSFHNISTFIMYTNKNCKLQSKMLASLCYISLLLLSA